MRGSKWQISITTIPRISPSSRRRKSPSLVRFSGHAHSLNLRDSGVSVRVGLPEGSASRAKAEKEGLTVNTPAEAAAWADVIMILAPDTKQPKLYRDAIAPNLKPGKTLMFAHGFNIRFGTIKPPANVDVSMIAPKAPGHRVREVFTEGAGLPRSSPSNKMPRARQKLSRLLTREGSAARVPASWKPLSPRRPRLIFSVSKPYSAAASAN